jgi:hypothetical protein
MVSKLSRLTHKVELRLHLVAESFTICSSRSRRTVWKLLDTHSYITDVLIFCVLHWPLYSFIVDVSWLAEWLLASLEDLCSIELDYNLIFRRSPGRERSYEYVEEVVADHRQGVVLQVGCWAGNQTPLSPTVKELSCYAGLYETWSECLRLG